MDKFKKIISIIGILFFSINIFCQNLDCSKINIEKENAYFFHSFPKEAFQCIISIGINKSSTNYYYFKANTLNPKSKESLENAKSSLKFAQSYKDSLRACTLMAEVFFKQKRYNDAQEYFLKTLSILHNVSDIELKARINYNILDFATDRRDSFLIEISYNNLKKLDLKGLDELIIARVKYYIAKYLHNEGTIKNVEVEYIISLLKQSKNTFTIKKSFKDLSNTLDLLAVCYVDTLNLNFSKAEQYHLESIKLKEELGNDRGVAISELNFCNLLAEKKLDFEAIEHCKKAAKISEKIESYDVLEYSYYNISYLYEENDSLEQAYFYYKKEIEARDSFLANENRKYIQDLQTQYQTKEKDQQIKTQKQRNQYLLITSILLLFIASLISFLYRQKNKLNKIITGQKEELEKLNGFKNQLFSIMGHDLRGMMSKLNLSQRKIARSNKKEGNEIMEAPISKMGGVIENLNGFIENILYWGFTQTERLHFNFQEWEATKIIDAVALNFKYDLENKGLKIQKDFPENFSITADMNTAKVVVRNILANAIKYSPEGGTIHISSDTKGEYNRIKIQDQGAGIPKEILPILFEVDNEKVKQGTQGEKGTGLGLWLCKEMMKKNNGTIHVESEQGKGTCFILAFPSVSN